MIKVSLKPIHLSTINNSLLYKLKAFRAIFQQAMAKENICCVWCFAPSSPVPSWLYLSPTAMCHLQWVRLLQPRSMATHLLQRETLAFVPSKWFTRNIFYSLCFWCLQIFPPLKSHLHLDRCLLVWHFCSSLVPRLSMVRQPFDLSDLCAIKGYSRYQHPLAYLSYGWMLNIHEF